MKPRLVITDENGAELPWTETPKTSVSGIKPITVVVTKRIGRTIQMDIGDRVSQNTFRACRAMTEPPGMITSTSKDRASGEIDCDSNWPEHAARERRTLERVSNGEM